jgi:acyl-CoA thioesterase FadM
LLSLENVDDPDKIETALFSNLDPASAEVETFVNLSYDFTSLITPRAPLEIMVRVHKKGKTSITFQVCAAQSGQAAFTAQLTCVFIERSTLRKITPPMWIEHALARFSP